ncbi:MAG: enoyl-CoA hydratase/isomerase family protein, partial [Acidimicrobiaceae bacterium]|nr:enoyl-CoA hydratase/isomerase family protein [Acidimicrobiaceae bacterium]
MDYDTITVSADGAVGTLLLDNPSKLNPLSVDCLLELTDAARWFDGHDAVKAVIVRGNGRAFTAGADLAAFTGGGGPGPGGTASRNRGQRLAFLSSRTWKWRASASTSEIFMISDGCIDNGPSFSQRWAPMPTSPTNST